MFLFLVIFNFFLAINTYSDTKSFVTLNEDINLRSLEDEKEPTKGSQKFFCVPLPQKPSLQKIPTIVMTPYKTKLTNDANAIKTMLTIEITQQPVAMKEKNS